MLEGILPPTGDLADTGQVIDSAILSDGSIPRPDTSATLINGASAPNEGTVNFTQSPVGGSHVAGDVYRYRFAYTDPNGTEATPSDERHVTVAPGNTVINLSNLPPLTNGADTVTIAPLM